MEKEEKKRIRKTEIKRGMLSQKMVNFRCDNENVEWLQTKQNKGRYINDLIAEDRKKHQE